MQTNPKLYRAFICFTLRSIFAFHFRISVGICRGLDLDLRPFCVWLGSALTLTCFALFFFALIFCFSGFLIAAFVFFAVGFRFEFVPIALDMLESKREIRQSLPGENRW